MYIDRKKIVIKKKISSLKLNSFFTLKKGGKWYVREYYQGFGIKYKELYRSNQWKPAKIYYTKNINLMVYVNKYIDKPFSFTD